MTHELKCWPEFFVAVQRWEKLFEIRHNDRSFKVGDVLWLREFVPTTQQYTGQSVRRSVTYITDFPSGLRDGYICMGLGGIDICSRSRESSSTERSAESRRALTEEVGVPAPIEETKEKCKVILELSKLEVDALVIAELQRRFPRALPISVNYEPRTEGGFCHCNWVAPRQTDENGEGFFDG